MSQKKSRCADEIGERYGEIKCKGRNLKF